MSIRPKKKMFVCQPKILESKSLFFFFLILNFAFLNKNFKIKCLKI